MKKFLAVLLAVALLGVAGAAFAAPTDDAAHHGKGTAKVSFSLPQSVIDSIDKEAKNVPASGDVVKVDESSKPSNIKYLTLPEMKSLDVGTKYIFAVGDSTGLQGTNVDSTSEALRANEAYVSVADAVTAKFYDANYSDVTGTSIPSSGYVVFTATATDMKTILTSNVKQSGPTSNKGSGGCNAGFASLAVLALSALALRRKAR